MKEKALAETTALLVLRKKLKFYRILRAENMQNHRGNSKPPNKQNIPTTFIADDPNQVWTWVR